MVICLFRKGVTNVSTMLWVIVKSRFKFEFFTLFWNCFTAFWASKISRWRGQVLGKCTCNKNKWAFGIFKQWPKQDLIKVPNVEVSGLFRDRDFQFVLSLDTSLIVFLNHWLSKFVQVVPKSSSERYPSRTVYVIIAGIRRYLAEKKPGTLRTVK